MGEQPWSRQRWAGLLIVLLGAQLFLLGWFGARTPLQPRSISSAPQFQLADETSTAVLAITGPMLFAQGHPQGFSGSTWMSVPVPDYQPPDWSEPPQWLPLDAQQLGMGFRRFLQTNPPVALAFATKPTAPLAILEARPIASATATPSDLHLEGPLSTRSLLNSPALRGWEHSELLTNSLVRVLVNPDGNVVSEVLLISSGLKAADDEALARAGAAQFEPLPRTPGGEGSVPQLAWGTLVFEWQTLPSAATNGPTANP